MPSTNWFTDARYGMFIHYGLYSLLARGEWVMNREKIAPEEYRKLADRFTAEHYDADAICDLAVRSGMRYIVLTTMHHEGFRLFETALSPFNAMNSAAHRDLVKELVTAARKRGLRIGLYHSLNQWMDQPDAVAALEDPKAYEIFMANTFARLRELATLFNPIDVMWYDGWWPFNAEGWRGEEMNAMIREIQPHILFNGRNGLPGDFATPEGHLGAPRPWRPWEACITMNDSWGFCKGDHNWKDAGKVVDMLATVAQGKGNLLLNIGPRGDGSIPLESVRVLEAVGGWLQRCGECIFGTDLFTYDLQEKADHRGDWAAQGPMTVKGNALYHLVRRWPGATHTISGVQANVKNVTLLGSNQNVAFTQQADKIVCTGLPDTPPDPVCPVLRFTCDREPSVYLTGGLRVPNCPHPHYDPCPSDMAH